MYVCSVCNIVENQGVFHRYVKCLITTQCMYGAMHGVHTYVLFIKILYANKKFSSILLQDFNCTLVKLNTVLFRLLTCSVHNTVYLKY